MRLAKRSPAALSLSLSRPGRLSPPRARPGPVSRAGAEPQPITSAKANAARLIGSSSHGFGERGPPVPRLSARRSAAYFRAFRAPAWAPQADLDRAPTRRCAQCTHEARFAHFDLAKRRGIEAAATLASKGRSPMRSLLYLLLHGRSPWEILAGQEAATGENEGAVVGGTSETGCSAPAGKAIVTFSTDRRSATATAPDPNAMMTECVINVQEVKVLGLAAAPQDTNRALGTVIKASGFNIRACEEPFEVDGRAQVQYNADNLLSVATWIGSYSSGAAHPNSYGAFMSFDLESGERLQLKDVITPEGKETVKAELLAAINRTKDDEVQRLWLQPPRSSTAPQSSNTPPKTSPSRRRACASASTTTSPT